MIESEQGIDTREHAVVIGAQGMNGITAERVDAEMVGGRSGDERLQRGLVLDDEAIAFTREVHLPEQIGDVSGSAEGEESIALCGRVHDRLGLVNPHRAGIRLGSVGESGDQAQQSDHETGHGDTLRACVDRTSVFATVELHDRVSARMEHA